GAGMGLGGDVISGIVNTSQDGMTRAQRREFDESITRFKAEGFNQTESELHALDDFIQTPEGEKIVNESIEENKPGQIPTIEPIEGVTPTTEAVAPEVLLPTFTKAQMDELIKEGFQADATIRLGWLDNQGQLTEFGREAITGDLSDLSPNIRGLAQNLRQALERVKALPQPPVTPEVTQQLKDLGWTDTQIQELDEGEIGSIIRNKQRPTLFQTPEEIAQVTATARATGAIGAKAITPKFVGETSRTSESILDFGSGKTPIHTNALREQGFDVTAFDVGANVVEGVHDVKALERTYDTVFASNVINVAPSEAFLRKTLGDIKSATNSDGRAIFNYPVSPRKLNLSNDEMLGIIKEFFPSVERVGGTNQAPLWEAKPKPPVTRGVGEAPTPQTTIGVIPESIEDATSQFQASEPLSDDGIPLDPETPISKGVENNTNFIRDIGIKERWLRNSRKVFEKLGQYPLYKGIQGAEVLIGEERV
ncbi:hypothetical protein LCGC14_2557140, partial [marine sediment metagenome]